METLSPEFHAIYQALILNHQESSFPAGTIKKDQILKYLASLDGYTEEAASIVISGNDLYKDLRAAFGRNRQILSSIALAGILIDDFYPLEVQLEEALTEIPLPFEEC